MDVRATGPLTVRPFVGFRLVNTGGAGPKYIFRSGARVGGGAPLICHPVRADDDGRILIGLDMDFTPSLPGF